MGFVNGVATGPAPTSLPARSRKSKIETIRLEELVAKELAAGNPRTVPAGRSGKRGSGGGRGFVVARKK